VKDLANIDLLETIENGIEEFESRSRRSSIPLHALLHISRKLNDSIEKALSNLNYPPCKTGVL
jgi:hypothetical protein